jgi:hypothetical protein
VKHENESQATVVPEGQATAENPVTDQSSAQLVHLQLQITRHVTVGADRHHSGLGRATRQAECFGRFWGLASLSDAD